MKNRIYAICGVVFLFPVLALSQQPNPAAAAPAQQAPVLNPRPAYAPAPNAGEGRFHLDVQVTDKQGKPVTGLELQDFTLLDDGRPAKILSFHAIDAAAQGTGPATDVVLLIDAVDVDFQTVSRTRDEIERFLRQNDGRLAHPVSIFIYNDTGVKILQQPSTDGNALAAQLHASEAGLRVIGRAGGENWDIERFSDGIKWIIDIAKNFARKPGRKLLIWAGPGWPLLDQVNIEPTPKAVQQMFNNIVELSGALREGHTTLYSVNLGLPNGGTYLYQGYLKGVRTAGKANPPNLGLKVLAVQSGGLVLAPSNDLASELETCVQDAGAFYTISFDPPKADKPNEYHDLKVVVGKPGLTARTSTGYYNQP